MIYVTLLHSTHNCYGFADHYCGSVDYVEGYKMMLMVLSDIAVVGKFFNFCIFVE